ncbi:CocE/NonD family hydrolase [Pseudonocardia sichuanensis]
MEIVDEFPHAVREDACLEIPMSDGTRLAARVWRPEDSDGHPVPAVLEFIPYRQRDLTAVRDSIHHPYFAGHGFAGVRVDLRGSGDSEGVLTDEYLEQELRDAEEVLAWIAAQPWCDGRTGMMGISWGGFNALQVAARRPPSLRAIVTASSTDDRYADDVHYMGGCLLTDNLSWASTMFAYTSCPPDPDVVGERWRDMWHERLRGSGLWLHEWLRHQHRDAYWRHGSVCEDFSAIRCPVLAVSGWADGYSNSVFRLLAALDVPRKGLVGPWSHKYPHLGQPGPAVGFLQELVRWWGRWLRDEDNGVMDEPMLRIWMQESVPPSTAYAKRPGRWVGEPSWPSPQVHAVAHPLGDHRILAPDRERPADLPERLAVQSPLSVGQFAGKWCSYNAPPDLPYDQREEDGGSLVFDGEVLAERMEILGSPVVDLEFAVDRPVAMVAARLSDVDPDGRATRISYGLLNLTHRDGHDRPAALVPGERYRVRVVLNAMAQAVPPGHRLRLSLSTSYWPLAWPPPEPVRLTVFPAGSALELPLRPDPGDAELPVPPLGQPAGARPRTTTQVQPGRHRWAVTRDLVGYESALEVVKDLGVVRFDDIDLEVTRRADERYGWVGDDVDSACGETTWSMGFARGDWKVETVTRTVLSSTATEFRLYAQLDAYEGTERVHAQSWRLTVPRDHV